MAAPSANLLAFLRPETITVSFANRHWPLAARNASDWLGAIARDFDTLAGVFPGLIADQDLEAMLDLSMREDFASQWFSCAQEALQWGSGRDWWWTLNLAKRSVQGWIYINGKLVREGVRADAIGFPDWLDAAYTLLLERQDENGRTKLDMELSMRPRGVRVKQNAAQTRRMLEEFAAD